MREELIQRIVRDRFSNPTDADTYSPMILKKIRASVINAEKGLYGAPYDETQARRAATQKSEKEHDPKWKAPLRYVKDRHNTPSIHSGQNRQERRDEKAMLRNGYMSRDGWVQGSRVRNRRAARRRALGPDGMPARKVMKFR